MENTKTISTNKKAFHEYFVLESFEAGISLAGTEVKSIRQGGVNLKDAWCSIENGEMLIKQMHISPYEHGNIFNLPSMRNRKLLLHKREIMRLMGVSNWYIKTPLIMQGALYGFFGAIFALIPFNVVQNMLNNVHKFFMIPSPIYAGNLVMMSMFLFGILFGAGGSFLSIKKHLQG